MHTPLPRWVKTRSYRIATLMAGFISISGHSLTRRNTVSRGTGLPDSALGHPSRSFRTTRPTLGHADATQRSRESPRSRAADSVFCDMFCYHSHSSKMRQLMIWRRCSGSQSGALLSSLRKRCSCAKLVAHSMFATACTASSFAQEHGVGAYGKARADVCVERARMSAKSWRATSSRRRMPSKDGRGPSRC